MKPQTLIRLALSGSRTDTLRVMLTAASSALAAVALLAAAAVVAVPELGTSGDGSEGWNQQYTNPLLIEPGLRPGVVATLLLLAIPVLALAGQCIRFGAPARDRRLAALRLAGATPGQAVLVASAETVAAALLGSLLGVGVFLALRAGVHRRDAHGRLPLPTDVLPSTLSFILVLLVVPLLAGLIGAFLLRKVIITPLGVTRRVSPRAPRLWPGLLILIGVLAPFVAVPLSGVTATWNDGVVMLVMVAVVLLAVVGVVAGTGLIAYTAGRALQRYGRRPGMLLAGRQLMADPWSGSRTMAALLAGVVVGAGVLCFRAMLVTEFAARAEANRLSGDEAGFAENSDFYLNTVTLLNVAVGVAVAVAASGIMVALAEGIVARRRAYAALVATGVPRRTLGESVAWQTLSPLLPALVLALTMGAMLVRPGDPVVTASSGSSCSGTPAQCADPSSPFWVAGQQVKMAVPLPWGDLLLLGGGTFAVMLVVVAVGWLFLRMSTDLEELRIG